MKPAADVIASAKKVRLVVGLFGSADRLASALADLRAQGLKPAQMNVIAQAGAFQGALSGWPEDGEARGFASWIVCGQKDRADQMVVAPAGPDHAASTAEQDARVLLGLHHWALRRQVQQLHRHLQDGGALLLIEPATDAEERTACTALLRFTTGGVQTHEITRSLDR